MDRREEKTRNPTRRPPGGGGGGGGGEGATELEGRRQGREELVPWRTERGSRIPVSLKGERKHGGIVYCGSIYEEHI